MQCLACEYSLQGLPAGPCPECGRPFDPARRPTYGPHEWAPVSRNVVIASLLAAGWPVLVQGSLHLMWLVAALQLGRWPGTGGMMDDPSSVPGIWLMFIMMIILILTPVMIPTGLVMLFAHAILRPRLGLALLGLGAALCAAGILIGDPVGAWDWFWD